MEDKITDQNKTINWVYDGEIFIPHFYCPTSNILKRDMVEFKNRLLVFLLSKCTTTILTLLGNFIFFEKYIYS